MVATRVRQAQGERAWGTMSWTVRYDHLSADQGYIKWQKLRAREQRQKQAEKQVRTAALARGEEASTTVAPVYVEPVRVKWIKIPGKPHEWVKPMTDVKSLEPRPLTVPELRCNRRRNWAGF